MSDFLATISSNMLQVIGIGIIPSQNIKSQQYMDKISEWTTTNQMKLYEKKSKVMVFNYTRNYQFATRVHLDHTLLETIHETTLLVTEV